MKICFVLALVSQLDILPALAAPAEGCPALPLVQTTGLRTEDVASSFDLFSIQQLRSFANGGSALYGEGGWHLFNPEGRFVPNYLGHRAPLTQQPDGDWLLWGRNEGVLTYGYGNEGFLGFSGDAALLPGGKILLVGYYRLIAADNDSPLRLVQVGPDLQPAEDPVFQHWSSGEVFPLAYKFENLRVYPLQDGSFLVYDGEGATTPEIPMQRVLPNGTVTPFANYPLHGHIRQIWQQGNGNILLLGSQINHPVEEVLTLMRFSPSGAPDLSFAPVSTPTQSMVVQADGRILLSEYLNNQNIISRLLPNGTPDESFTPIPISWGSTQLGISTQGRLMGLTNVPDGSFPSLLTFHLALPEVRLSVAGNTIRWMRGGTAPEITWAEFQLYDAEAETWIPVGPGTKIPGGWETTATTPLPVAGKIRVYTHHHTTISTNEYRQEAYFGPSPLTAWKRQHFSNPDAADLADPDGDGVANLIEYGLGTDPTTADRPLRCYAAEALAPPLLTFERDAARFDVDVLVEAATSLVGPWETLAQSLNGGPLQSYGKTSEEPVDPSTGVQHCTVRDWRKQEEMAARFYRVRVERR